VRRLVGEDVANFVVFVHEDDFGFVRGDFGFGQHDVGHDDDDVAFLDEPCGGTVETDDAAAAFAGDGVGFEAFAVVVVDDGDFFVNEDACGVEQVLVYGDAADVVEVGFGNGGAVYLAAEHGAEHGFPFGLELRMQTEVV